MDHGLLFNCKHDKLIVHSIAHLTYFSASAAQCSDSALYGDVVIEYLEKQVMYDLVRSIVTLEGSL